MVSPSITRLSSRLRLPAKNRPCRDAEEPRGLVGGQYQEPLHLQDAPSLVQGVVGPPSLGELVEPGTEQLHSFGEPAGQGVVFLTLSVGLEKRIWGIAQRAKAVSEGQGEKPGRLLEGTLSHRPGPSVSKPGQEKTVAIG